MDEKQINAIFKSQLHARMINYDLYFFESGSVSVIIKVRSTKLTIQLPYIIEKHNNNIVVSSPERVWKLNTNDENIAVQLIVKDVRKQEVKFNKFSK
ncbi:hypothetical protein HYO65_gp025 [Tenacibaculum phage PTm1]|uniref:Uncharacterized protein n=2 Tax=Shirahamavirus PTm1 TaxID=2846435 RepID=A0A5S9BYZ3_9CAUD|nr:hypothetical protein HYO65_gp025 [Tenacibaculum phage PTm1]BBI90417.1 hypothetical protein [Tenacibaculum phage PTm1]BBI90725.1 hypothetical protein [Tenacibaculum phage PTm5]